ncbi:MAG: orotate phosphoribosyltransferase [Candidatus Odinarchaeia archaeon]
MKKWQSELINFLAMKRGLLFGNFKLKSGRISPYFFNLAKTIEDGEGILKISEFYVHGIFDIIGGVNFDFIIGPAYKAIPIAASIALLLQEKYGKNVRWGYDRKEKKGYGVGSEEWLVGNLKDGDKILIVDDVTTTGETKINLIKKIKEIKSNMNLDFIGVLILLDRQELDSGGRYVGDVLNSFGVKLFSLLKVEEVFEYLRGRKINNEIIVSEEDYQAFLKYKAKYGVP